MWHVTVIKEKKLNADRYGVAVCGLTVVWWALRLPEHVANHRGKSCGGGEGVYDLGYFMKKLWFFSRMVIF